MYHESSKRGKYQLLKGIRQYCFTEDMFELNLQRQKKKKKIEENIYGRRKWYKKQRYVKEFDLFGEV